MGGIEVGGSSLCAGVCVCVCVCVYADLGLATPAVLLESKTTA